MAVYIQMLNYLLDSGYDIISSTSAIPALHYTYLPKLQ